MEKKAVAPWILPWRYALFLLACTSMVPLSLLLGKRVGIMAGFDVAVIVFLATIAPFFGHDAPRIRGHARDIDANRTTILVLTGVVMSVMLVVIASDLRQKVVPSTLQLVLIMATLVLAWLFSNIIYTLHYAYLFYRDGQPAAQGDGEDHRGLEFPDKCEPDYWDFAYFAFTLGMTFQTSDVSVTSSEVRRVVLLHSLAAFVFNLGVLAFTINILGG